MKYLIVENCDRVADPINDTQIRYAFQIRSNETMYATYMRALPFMYKYNIDNMRDYRNMDNAHDAYNYYETSDVHLIKQFVMYIRGV